MTFARQRTAALAVATGDVTHRITARHTAADFLAFMRQVVRVEATPSCGGQDEQIDPDCCLAQGVVLDRANLQRSPRVVDVGNRAIPMPAGTAQLLL